MLVNNNMAEDDKVMQSIKLVALVLFVVLALLWLLSVSCYAGYCSTHDCSGGGKEGFTGPGMQTQSLGGYNRLGRFGKGGIWFDVSRGAGAYYGGPGGSGVTSGFYSAPSIESQEHPISGIHNPKTPECMAANCGRFDEPKNVKGCGCLGPEVCCGKCRGCKADYLPYFAGFDCGSGY
jgi:hypothetical protein